MAGQIHYTNADGINATPVSAANPLPVINGGTSANVATNQVSIGTSATLIAAARPGRTMITVVNTTTTQIFLGPSGLTTGNALPLPGVVGASVTLQFSGALYGIVASGTATVGEAEVY